MFRTTTSFPPPSFLLHHKRLASTFFMNAATSTDSENKFIMRPSKTGFGNIVELPGVGYEQAIAKTTECLKKEGFGVLTSIDVKKTMKEKIDVEFRPYVILGACNPRLALQALRAESDVGLLLPCNVTVEETVSGSSRVTIVDPIKMLQVTEGEDGDARAKNEALKLVSATASEKLTRVAQDLMGKL